MFGNGGISLIISHKYKFIFVKTRKTAGSSIQMYLSGLCGSEDTFTPMDRAEQFYTSRNYRGLINPFSQVLNTDSRKGKIVQPLWRFLTFKKFYSHISAQEISRMVPMKIWDDYYKFAVDRNPWDKVLSHYHYSRQRFDKYDKDISFDDFISSGDLPHNFHK